MAKDFGMTPNNPGAGEAVAAPAAAPAGQGEGTSDHGAAQAEAREVTAEQFAEAFELDPNAEGEGESGKPVKQTVVDTGDGEGEKPDGEKPDGEKPAEGEKPDGEKPAEGDAAAEGEATAEGDDVTIEDFLKDTDDDTRQDLLTALMADEKLSLNFERDGKPVSEPVADVLRAAAGYPGAEAVTARAAELKKAEDQLDSDQKAFSKTLADPSEFLDYMEGHLDDPVKFYTSIRDRAESVLKESEDDPAAFKRKHADRRSAVTDRQEAIALREEVANLRRDLRGDTPPRKVSASEETSIRQEGEKRRSAVETSGFNVDVVDNHWVAAGAPTDFARWFGAWSAVNPGLKGKGTPKSENGEKPDSETGGKKKRKTLRRSGNLGPGKPTAVVDDKPLDADGIESFLREHPSNAHLKK